MTHEFYYTSAPHGLVKGSKGFCAVAMTKGLPTFLSERLEDLSGYKALYTALDDRNPVNWAHYRLDLGGHTYHVVSRICSAGLDYSERTNKFAHHIVLTPDDLPAAGPAWLLQQKGFLETAWDQGEPRWLSAGRKVPQGNAYTKVCKTWEKLTGDAGWAGVLAETAVSSPARPAIVLYEPDTNVLALFAEALQLLPEKYRWRVTFSTYASSVPPGETCLWRGLTKAEAEHDKRSLLHGALVISLGSTLGRARGGALVESARTGKAANIAAIAPSSSTSTLTTPTKSKQSVGEENEHDHSLPQVSLSSLGPSRNDPIQEVGDDVPAESSIRRYLEIGLSTFLGLGVGFLLLFLAAVTGIIDLPNRELSKTNSELQTKVADLEVEKDKIPGLNSQIGHLKNQLGTQKSESKTVSLELTKTKERIAALEKRQAELDKLLEEKEKERAFAESERMKLQSEKIKLIAERDALKETIKLFAKQPPVIPKTEPELLKLSEADFRKAEGFSIELEKAKKETTYKWKLHTSADFFQLYPKDPDTYTMKRKAQKDLFLTIKLYNKESVSVHFLPSKETTKLKPMDLRKAIEHLEQDLRIDLVIIHNGTEQMKQYRLKIEPEKK